MESIPINAAAVAAGCAVLASASGYALFRGGRQQGWTWIDLVFLAAVTISTLLIVRLLAKRAAFTLERAVRRTRLRPARRAWGSSRHVRHHRA